MNVVNLMNVTDMLNNVTLWSAPLFEQFQDVIYVSVGFVGGALIILWFGDTIKNALAAVFGRKDDSIF